MRILYFDCFSGASGDMILGALMDAGAPLDEVRAAIDALGIPGWDLELARVQRAGVRAAKATVTARPGGPDRSYRDIVALIANSRLPERTADLAGRAFAVLARAEARVHGVAEDEVRFHEVGALDSIIDVVGSCAALAILAPGRVVASALPSGLGSVETAHGTLPLPPPAVVEILTEANAPLYSRGRTELVTPTGAALLATFADDFGDLPPMRLEATGYGAGDRDLDRPNVLRILVGESTTNEALGPATLVECNIDDMSPELIPHLIEELLLNGAQDAWVTPTVMKKGRPAFVLSVLASRSATDHIADVLFRETTTLGLRTIPVIKEALERRWVTVTVAGHSVRVKLGLRRGEVVTIAPEHDDAADAARATGMPLKNVYAAALRAATPTRP